MILSKERKGDLFVFSGVSLWSLFPVITILSYNTLSPLVSLEGSTLFAALFFAAVLTVRGKWHEFKRISALKEILISSLLLGVFYYILTFFGLSYTSAGNVSIIALTEIFFSYLLFHVWRKDYMPMQHKLGAVLTVLGALIVLYPKISGFSGGELLILLAAAIAPIGNFFQQKARKTTSSEVIMFIRSIVSAVVIFILLMFLKIDFSLVNLQNSFLLLLINGAVLFGLTKIFWIEGIHRISVTKANALSSTGPLLTLFFAWIILKNPPTIWQMVSFIPMFFGVLLLSKNQFTKDYWKGNKKTYKLRSG